MRQLPGFSDLFFLPAAFDPASRTTLDLEEHGIRSEMSSARSAREYEEYLTAFPHVHAARSGDAVLVKSREVASETALVQWPDGRSFGVILYEGGYYSAISEVAVVEMLAAGRGLSVIEAEQGEGRLEPLKRHIESGAARA